MWEASLFSPHMNSLKKMSTKQIIMNVVEGMETNEPSYTVGVNVRWHNHYGKQ